MNWTSIVAIYFLIWVMCAFFLLPFGVQTHDEAGIAKVKGQADSAPANFRPGRLAVRATIMAVVVCGLYVANYDNDWITAEDINIFGTPPDFDNQSS